MSGPSPALAEWSAAGAAVAQDLVFDVGMHRGEDTGYYLREGYRVVAIDADPRLIEHARVVFADAVRTGRLTLVVAAIGAADGELDFHLSERSIWNSTNRSVSTRENAAAETVRVQACRLSHLFDGYGVPFYCKIDIEGMDAACLRSLQGALCLPEYISAETECLGGEDHISEAEALETLDELQRLGYRKFKLVDQTSLMVLSPSTPVYRERPPVWERALRRLGLGGNAHYSFSEAIEMNRARLNAERHYSFPKSASGPFGTDLHGAWLDADAARVTLLRHRRDYFRMTGAKVMASGATGTPRVASTIPGDGRPMRVSLTP